MFERKSQIRGLVSLIICLVFTSLFFILYQTTGPIPRLMPYVTVFGKIATWVDIGAFLLAGAGVIWDRKKAASLAALFLTIISAGLIGMYVYNI